MNQELPAAHDHVYDAFISYSHRDAALARWLRHNLRRIGRGPTQRRALNVYLDTAELGANPDLWESVCTSMDASAHLVVVLSPEAATSKWVRREIGRWIETRPDSPVLLALARGTLGWDSDAGGFTQESDALPPELRQAGIFKNEPLYVDLREHNDSGFHSPVLRERGITLAAAVHGVPRSKLADDDRREVARARLLRRTAVAGLVVLTVASSGAAVVAVNQRQEARRQTVQAETDRKVAVEQRNQAVASSLDSASKEESDNPALALALAIEGYAADPGLADSLAALVTARVTYSQATLQPKGKQIAANASAALAVSSDGRVLAAATGDGLGLYNATSGELMSDLALPEHAVSAAAFGPGDDLLAVGNYHRLRVYRAGQGYTDLADYSANDEVLSLAISATVPVLAACDRRGLVLYDTAALTLPVNKMGPRGPAQCSLAFNAGGTRLAAVIDGVVSLYKVSDSRHLTPVFTVPVGGARGVAFGADDNVVVGGAGIRTLDRSGYASTLIPSSSGGSFRPLALTSDGSRLVTGDGEPTLDVFDTAVKREVQQVTVDPHEVGSVALSRDGSTLVSAGAYAGVRTFDVNTEGRAGFRRFGDDYYDVRAVAIGPQGEFAAGGQRLRFFDRTGRPVESRITTPPSPKGSTQEVVGAAYSPDGRTFVAYNSNRIQMWDVATQTLRWEATSSPTSDFEQRASFSPDGSVVAVSGYHGEAYVWDVATGKQKAMLSSGTTAPGVATALLDDHALIGAFGTGQLVLWDLDTDEVTTSTRLSDGVYSMAHDDKSDRIAVGTGSGRVIFLDDRTLKEVGVALAGHQGIVSTVTLSPDGRQLLSGGQDSTVRLWDVRSGRQLALVEHRAEGSPFNRSHSRPTVKAYCPPFRTSTTTRTCSRPRASAAR